MGPQVILGLRGPEAARTHKETRTRAHTCSHTHAHAARDSGPRPSGRLLENPSPESTPPPAPIFRNGLQERWEGGGHHPTLQPGLGGTQEPRGHAPRWANRCKWLRRPESMGRGRRGPPGAQTAGAGGSQSEDTRCPPCSSSSCCSLCSAGRRARCRWWLVLSSRSRWRARVLQPVWYTSVQAAGCPSGRISNLFP